MAFMIESFKGRSAADLQAKNGMFCSDCCEKTDCKDGFVCLEYLLEVLINRHGLTAMQCLKMVREFIQQEKQNGEGN